MKKRQGTDTITQTVPGMDTNTTRIEGLDANTDYIVLVSATNGAGTSEISTPTLVPFAGQPDQGKQLHSCIIYTQSLIVTPPNRYKSGTRCPWLADWHCGGSDTGCVGRDCSSSPQCDTRVEIEEEFQTVRF